MKQWYKLYVSLYSYSYCPVHISNNLSYVIQRIQLYHSNKSPPTQISTFSIHVCVDAFAANVIPISNVTACDYIMLSDTFHLKLVSP